MTIEHETGHAAEDAGKLLKELLGDERVKTAEPMAGHCSFRTGGPADLFLYIRTFSEMQAAVRILKDTEMPYFILGRGSNLLVGDRGYRGCILTMTGEKALPVTDTLEETFHKEEQGADTPLTENTCGLAIKDNSITAGAGVSLAFLAGAARTAGLAGLAFAAGIPGSVGGGLVMNAGAYDGELKQCVRSVLLLMPDGTLQWKSREEMAFGYRTSLLKKIPAIALEAVFDLTPDDPERITARMQELARKRKEKQPLEFPSAGSTFKRPEGMFAGKLIEDAGLRGYSRGGAAVSEKHCGFVVNKNGATSRDIRNVIEDVKKRVLENSGVLLEEEVIFLGEF